MKQLPKIATPISHLFENRQFGEEISAVSDCLEVRERSLDSQHSNQYLFHIDIDLTHEWDESIRSYLQQAFEKKIELKLVTFQVTRCCHGEKIDNGIFQLDGKVYSKQEMLNHASVNTKWLKSILEENIKIGLENNNYYPTLAYDIVTDGDFITEVINQNEIYLLLDIAHAMVTAHNQKITYQEYIESLPLDSLIQLHICQPELLKNSTAYDAHDVPDSEMMKEVIRLVGKYPQILYLTIEYYKDKDLLVNSIEKLSKLLVTTIV